MDAKTYQEVYDTLPKNTNDVVVSEKKIKELLVRLAAAEAKVEALELVVIVANDIVNEWPSLTMRKLGAMTQQVDTLKQALIAAK